MALRFFLVTVVTALGLNPPSSDQFSQWTQAGRTWIAARLDDINGALVVAKDAQLDASFDKVVDTMKADFSADLAKNSQPKPKAELVFEPITVPEVLACDFGMKMNELAGGAGFATDAPGPPITAMHVKFVLVGPPTSLAVVQNELVGPPANLASGSDVESNENGETSGAGRVHRLISAVQLTRQAAAAWMTLLDDSSGASVRR